MVLKKYPRDFEMETTVHLWITWFTTSFINSHIKRTFKLFFSVSKGNPRVFCASFDDTLIKNPGVFWSIALNFHQHDSNVVNFSNKLFPYHKIPYQSVSGHSLLDLCLDTNLSVNLWNKETSQHQQCKREKTFSIFQELISSFNSACFGINR